MTEVFDTTKLDEHNLIVQDHKTAVLHERYLRFYLRKFAGKKNTRYTRWKVARMIKRLTMKFIQRKTCVLASRQ